jgi:O-acetyl-ADP-ribose deacetylase (regulator of RNase III)
MLEFKQGNLLEEDAEALVNAVNCVGVMGKGIALQFKQAFPYIINFPTKRHWRDKSKIEDIQAGLKALVAEVQQLSITSIAIPALGCGNGGLDWLEVKPLIESAFVELPEVKVVIFEPADA